MSLLGNIWVKLGLRSDDFNRGMDNAEKRSRSFGEVMKGVAGKVMAVVAAFKAMAGTLKIITDFEAAQSRLASVLGTTVDKMGRMTDAAIDLGRRTQYTASQVTELQTELAKLGFAEPDILSMQESVLKFAAAVGTDLASAAARAGATMRGFGLSAEETAQMLEVMAVSTSKSALSFSYLDSTLGKLVPVARSFGLDTKGTIALLGTLANAGIDASSAGTALRNIFIRLSDSSSNLNKAIGEQPRTMEDLIVAFQTLRDKHVDLGQAQELVDKRSASVLLSLMNNADACADLYRELGNANGALDEMYDTMTHNVKGAVDQVKSAWEGFVLSLRSSTGILYNVLSGVAQLIGDLNYALFMGTKNSTETARAYDELKRTIEQTANPVAALDRAYKALLDTANQRVTTLEGKSAIARLLNHESLDEARARVNGLTAAYQQLKGELTAPKKGGGGGPVVNDDADPLAQLLASMNKSKTKEAKEGIDDVARAAREYAQEVAEINAADEEMSRQASALLEKYHQEHEVIDETTASLVALNYAQIASIDAAEAMAKRMGSAFDELANGLRNGLLDALDELAEAIGTGNWDTTTMMKALVSPLADAAISAGMLIMTTGEGLEAVKKAFESLNGYAAIAAGAALVGLGVTLKAGMAAIAANAGGGSPASAGGNPYTYAGGYGVNPAAANGTPATVEITGTLTAKGEDLQIVLDNYNRNKLR